MTTMVYSNLIPREQIVTVASGVIRRYRQDASDQDCEDLLGAFLILSKYLENFFTGDFYTKIECTEKEFQQLNAIATSYKNTFETWSELIGLSPTVIRYNVRLTNGFSIICNEIAVRLNGKAAEYDREPIKVLGIDIETFSSVDITKCGLYKYVESDDFTILLFAYACDDKPVQIVDFASGEKLPERIFLTLTDPNVLKTAFNASFERICIGRYYGIDLPIEQWECTMARSAMLGLPLSLAQVGKVLNLEDQKMTYRLVFKLYASVSANGVSSMAEVTIIDISVSFSKSGYISRFFANGMSLGTSTDNIFAVFNKRNALLGNYIQAEMHNKDVGFRILAQKLLAKQNPHGFSNEIPWGMVPRIVASGKAKCSSSFASFAQATIFDNSSLSISRHSKGRFLITLPSEWSKYELDKSGYVMVTGYGYVEGGSRPVSATVTDFIANSFFVVLSDGGAPCDADGGFYFEIKVY